jgi:hypothetical protein
MEMSTNNFHVTYINGDGHDYFKPGKLLGEFAKKKFKTLLFLSIQMA